MTGKEFDLVTGAFGFAGRYITDILLKEGAKVRTLTGHPERRNPHPLPVEVMPYEFENPAALVEKLRGARTLFNTYWVRFDRGRTTHGQAVANSQNLIRAAAAAGVRRFVHISIANPSLDSPLPYYRGKAAIERTLANSGLSYAILRPTLLFGTGDILINNIAFLLRRMPVYGVFGAGDYRVQPVYVRDLAKLAVEAARSDKNTVIDAAGPETFSFQELVYLIRARVRSRSRIVHISPRLTHLLSHGLNFWLKDIIVTGDELAGLMGNLLASYAPPSCPTHFSVWFKEHADEMGRHYASELDRHFN